MDRPGVHAVPALAAALHELSAVLVGADDLDTMLRRTAEIAARTVPDGAGAAVTLLRYAGRPVVRSASDEAVCAVEESQFALGDGPGPAALRSGARADVPDVGTERRWPAFAAIANRAGIGSSRSEPLQVGATSAGLLSLHAARPRTFAGEAGHRARLVADHVQVLLAAHLRRTQQTRIAEELQRAMLSRATIDQAIGIVMVWRDCPPEQAFAVLREASNRSNTRLRVLASRLVESVGRQVGR